MLPAVLIFDESRAGITHELADMMSLTHTRSRYLMILDDCDIIYLRDLRR
jgi:hypothetical protein